MVKSKIAHLAILNEHMVTMAMNLKLPTEIIYIQECPMADNNKGTKWLRLEKGYREPILIDKFAYNE